MPTAPKLDALRKRCDGEVVGPGDERWDTARVAWNLAVDQQPAAVVLATSVDDVSETVRHAAEQGLTVAPQATGHNAGPLDLSGSVLVKTTAMTGVKVDPQTRRARVGAGALARDLAGAAAEHGLAPLGGSSPDVSVVGYSLGGGLGWLGREYGLQCHRITGATMVLADGTITEVSEDSDPELLWALRGGGGNLGIVTELELELVELTEVVAGAVAWDWSRSSEVLHRWAEWAEDAPEVVTTSFRILQLPPLPQIPEPIRGRQLAMVDGAICDPGRADEILAPLRELQPEIDMFGPVPTPALCHIHGDPEEPVPSVSASRMLDALPAEALDALADVAGPESGSPLLFTELRQLGGALGRPGVRDGALASLDGRYVLMALAMAMEPAMAEAGQAYAGTVAETLAPWAADRIYLNFTEQAADVQRAYAPEAWERLQEVRSRVDPDGVVRANHAVRVPG